MATQPATGIPDQPGTVPPSNGGSGVPAGPVDVEKESLRAKWRAKWQRRQERKKAAAAGTVSVPPPPPPPAPADVAPAPAVGDPASAGVPLGGPVPWTAANVQPLFSTLIPIGEGLAKESAVKEARDIGERAVNVVEKKYRWPQSAVKTIESYGPNVAAKWLNKTGVSAENAGEVILAGAIGAIIKSHCDAVAEIRAIARELKASRDNPPAPAPAPVTSNVPA